MSAGLTRCGLARALHATGVECVVVAPRKIERAANARVKTDRRDSERLVMLLMVGDPCAVRVASSEQVRFVTWSVRARTCAAI